MKQVMQKARITFLASSILLSSSISFANNAEDTYVYIGSELGVSEPIIKAFNHDTDSGRTTFRLKRSKMFGGRIGYSFYPGMMVEVSVTNRPEYRMPYKLPEQKNIPLPTGAVTTIASTSGQTKVSSKDISLNFIYEMQEKFMGVNPYIIMGGGLTKVSIKAADSYTDALSPVLGKGVPYFKIKKNKVNCYSFQIGGGITKDLTSNFKIDLGVKMQLVNDIKLKYDVLDLPATQAAGGALRHSPATPIKKTIGVGEFTLGFTYKIPV